MDAFAFSTIFHQPNKMLKSLAKILKKKKKPNLHMFTHKLPKSEKNSSPFPAISCQLNQKHSNHR